MMLEVTREELKAIELSLINYRYYLATQPECIQALEKVRLLMGTNK